MKKLFLVSMLCLTFTIPAKADFWKKLKNAVIGTDAASSSNSSGKTGGTRGYLVKDDWENKIVNPFDKNHYRNEDDIYAAERNSIYTHRDLQGISEKVNYVKKSFGEDEKLEKENNISRPTSFTLLKDGKNTGINFCGIPGGHEFNSFVLAILGLAGIGKKLEGEQLTKIQGISKQLNIETYISLSCTKCPEVANPRRQEVD